MKSIKEQIMSLIQTYIEGIESELENTYEILKIREQILSFLDKNKDIDVLLELHMDSLKQLVMEVFGESGKQKLTVDRINFIYEGSKICDDFPQLNAAKKELSMLLEEFKRKVKDYDNEIERIAKNNDKIIEKTKIYRLALMDLEENRYLKNVSILSDLILSSDLKESEMYQYILYLTKMNTSCLEGKGEVEDTVLQNKTLNERDFIQDYFDIIKGMDFTVLENKGILPDKNLANFNEIKGTLSVLFEGEISLLKKQLGESNDTYLQKNLEQLRKNYEFLKDYSNDLKFNSIIQNHIIYQLPQVRNTIIMEDFRKENFEKKDFKDIIDLVKEFNHGNIKKTEFFHNKLINTYKITKNNVNAIIISVKENTYVMIKLYRFGSTYVEKDVLERLNIYKNELELIIDELNHPVKYKELMDMNQEVEMAIFDTLLLNAKVG